MKRTLAVTLSWLLLALPALALSTQEEIAIGREAAARFEAQYGLVQDATMQRRLQRIGQELVSQAERQELPWRFRVIDVDEFNAAAFPGGFIYATRGLMNGLDDDELAFVVGHEIGHVDRRHSVRQLESARATQLGILAVLIGANRGTNIPQAQATLANLANAVIQSGFSREHEAESDRYGAILMARAGYDPVYSVLALDELSKQSGGGTPGFLNTILGSHPLPQDRVNEAAERVIALPYDPVPAPPVLPAPGERAKASLQLDPAAAQDLRQTLSLAGLNQSPALERRAEELAVNGGQDGLTRTFSAQASTAEMESILLKQARPGHHQFGLAVTSRPDGQREVTLILR